MKLNVDLTALHLAAAKMRGLDSYLLEIRKQGTAYRDGLRLAKEFVVQSGGAVEDKDETTVLRLHGEVAFCFQPYPDIDKFYFES